MPSTHTKRLVLISAARLNSALVLLAWLLSFGALGQTPPARAVIEYTFDISVASVDTSGHGNHLSDFKVGLAEDRFGGSFSAAQFAGDVGSYALAAGVTSLPMDQFSTAFWVKTTDAIPTHAFFSYATGTPADRNDDRFEIRNPANIEVIIYKTGIQTGVNVSDGRWHFLVMAWRSSDGQLLVYKDGRLAFTGTISLQEDIPQGGTLVLGQDQQAPGGPFNSAGAYAGLLDSLQFYDKVLTESEITALYKPATVTPVVSVSDAEANEVAGFIAFNVSLSVSSSVPVNVNFYTRSGTATDGVDYANGNRLITIPAGATNQTVRIPVVDDSLVEGTEFFYATLSDPQNADLGRAEGIGVLFDNDVAPSLKVLDTLAKEGPAATNAAVFKITLSAKFDQNVTVDYTTADGTAKSGSDYKTTTGRLTFTPGITNLNVLVPIVNDAVRETTETFFLQLRNPTNAVLDVALGQCTLLDDDVPTISMVDYQVVEGNDPLTLANFTVVLSGPSAQTILVNYQTANGTALAGKDYDGTSGTLSFAPGATNRIATIPIHGNKIADGDRFFYLNLSGATNANIGREQGKITILDDDATSFLSVSDITLLEGNSGNPQAVFKVTLNSASAKQVDARVVTADQSAVAGIDYGAVQRVVSFAPGQTNVDVAVALLPNLLFEADKTFLLKIQAATNASIRVGTAVCTILNDDPMPAVSIDDASVVEGNSGETVLEFPIRLSTAAGIPVSARLETRDGSAIAPGDYFGTNGVVLFAAGQITNAFRVLIHGDTLVEPVEAFNVVITSVTNASINRGTATGTIFNDDRANLPPLVSIIEPLDGIRVSVNQTVTFRVTGSDPDGKIDSLAVYQGTSALPMVAGPGGFFAWSNAVPGNYSFFAVATDDFGAQSTSAVVRVEVLPPANLPPLVQITSPTSGTTFPSGSNIVVTATASDADGFVANLSLFEGGFLLKAASVGSIALNWTNVAQGLHSIYAVAVDDLGAKTTSAVVRVEVLLPANLPPLVQITSPTSGATFSAGTNIVVTATASDADGFVASLSLFDAGFLLKAASVGSLTLNWTNSAEGLHSIYAVAVDDVGAKTTSAPVNLAVTRLTNPPPFIRITAPATATVFAIGAPIVISVEGGYPGAGSFGVGLYAGNILLTNSSAAPFSFTWTGVGAGDYALTARLTSPGLPEVISSSVQVSVVDLATDAAVFAVGTELSLIQDALTQIGFTSRPLGRNGLTTASLRSSRMVVVNLDFGLGITLTDADVGQLAEANRNGVGMIILGDKLTTTPSAWSPATVAAWSALTHLQPAGDGAANSNVIFTATGSRHPIGAGRFGVVDSVSLPEVIQLARTSDPNVDVLAVAGDSLGVLAFPSTTVEDTGQARLVVQNFLLNSGTDGASLESRRRLLQNEACWILRCPGCGVFDVSVTSDSVPPSLNVGESWTYGLQIRSSGECIPSSVVMSNFLGGGVEFVSTDLQRGTVTFTNGVLRAFLGRVAPGEPVAFTVTVRPTLAGVVTNHISITTPEPEQFPQNNSLAFDLVVTGPTAPRLTLSRISSGLIRVSAAGDNTRTVVLESSGDLRNWSGVATNPAGAGPLVVDQGISSNAVRFYRAKSVP